MVRRVRSLSFALVIVLVTSAVSGQQPKRNREPYISPLLPAEQAWRITLPAQPAASGVMDDAAVYIPLEEVEPFPDGAPPPSPARLVSLDRQTGATRWTSSVTTRLPPVLAFGLVIVATPEGIEAMDPRTGQHRWSVSLDQPVRARMSAQGPLLVAILEGGELIAVHLERRDVVWRRQIGEYEPVSITTDAEATYLATKGSRVMSVRLSDGSIRWERRLDAELSELVVDRDRVFVGSTAQPKFWAIDAETGRDKWQWPGLVFAGAVVGAAVQGDKVFVVSKDNIVRALDRGNGAQKWKKAVPRPLFPPRVLNGIVTVVGVSPALSTFRTDTGNPVSTWAFPVELLLQGAPLIDEPAPYRVAIVAIFRDGQIFGLRSTEMLFKEAAPVPLTTLPGRPVGREP